MLYGKDSDDVLKEVSRICFSLLIQILIFIHKMDAYIPNHDPSAKRNFTKFHNSFDLYNHNDYKCNIITYFV